MPKIIEKEIIVKKEGECDKCAKYDTLIQEYLEYRPFRQSYMDKWIEKLIDVHLGLDNVRTLVIP